MKTLIKLKMKYSFLYFFLIFIFFCGCKDAIDKSLISQTEKLNSPNGKFSLYLYFIESPMAFGSGFSAINIVNSKHTYDYTTRDFFRLNNDSPFWIKWKNEDTLAIKCLIDGGNLSGQQPVKRELKKWKDWTFEVKYYSLFSTTAEIKYSFDSYFIGTDFIRFNSKRDSIVFKMDEVQFSLDTGHIFVTQFKVDTFNFKPGIALSHYDLTATNSYNQNDFLKLQAFVMTDL